MIPKQKLYMLISIFFLTVAMVIYIFNGIIIPKKIDSYSKDIADELLQIRSKGYFVAQNQIDRGTFIDSENYTQFLMTADVYSDKNIRHISMEQIIKGFYTKDTLDEGDMLTLADIIGHMSEYGSRTYEVIVKNSFCGSLRAGDIVDLVAVNGSRINVLVTDKQIKGIYGFSGGRYIEAQKIQMDSDVILFIELTQSEYEHCLGEELIYARKLGELYGD